MAGPGDGRTTAPAVVTPDAVGLDLEVATVGSRGAAYLIDLAVFGVVLALLTLSQALLGGAGFVPGSLGIAALLVFAFLWQFGYPIGFEVLRGGRTPGKAMLGLRVVTVEGAPVGLRHATIRASVGVLELLGTGGSLAVISSFASSRHQRLGDLAAGTLVLRERRGGGAPAAEAFVAPPAYAVYAARLDVSALRAPDYAAVRETLRRARDLRPEVRAEVTGSLASRLVDRVAPPPPAGCTAEEFLTCVAAAVQARRTPTAAPGAPPAGTGAGRSRHPDADAPSARHDAPPAGTGAGRSRHLDADAPSASPPGPEAEGDPSLTPPTPPTPPIRPTPSAGGFTPPA